ncbi:MAG: transporter substrate-binding domain-containing protein [Minwuia sp.]|nr:transporter substrate-binding domain-containing protein [Minwuia sp.]
MRLPLRGRLTGLVTAAATALLLTAGAQAQPTPLTICLEEDSPPLSFSFGPRKGGFDHGVAEEIAKRMGRPLKIQWFESENDEEAVPVWEANALLSDGLCDLIAGYPLLGSTLGKPETDKGAVPEYEGMNRAERGRLVRLGVLSATQPYYRAGYGVIVGQAARDRAITRLADLKGLKLGAEVGTMASVLLFRNAGGVLVDDISNVSETKDLLPRTAEGEFDAVLIELHKFDNFKRRNPETPLRWSGYVHPFGVNMGMAVLERHGTLREQVNVILDAMEADGTLDALAERWQMTRIPPAAPWVLERLTPGMLNAG